VLQLRNLDWCDRLAHDGVASRTFPQHVPSMNRDAAITQTVRIERWGLRYRIRSRTTNGQLSGSLPVVFLARNPLVADDRSRLPVGGSMSQFRSG
jgi:hypothetical protein